MTLSPLKVMSTVGVPLESFVVAVTVFGSEEPQPARAEADGEGECGRSATRRIGILHRGTGVEGLRSLCQNPMWIKVRQWAER